MPNSQEVNNNRPLTDAQKAAYIARMNAAWENLPADQKAKLQPLLDTAHQQFGDFVQTGKAPEHRLHNILRMKSYLTGDKDKYLDNHAAAVAKAVEIKVGP